MSVAYFLLWSSSLALSVVLIVLLRTRWGQSRPLHKCAVLSLLVHVMLAWAAMTVRMIAGDSGGGSGPPIRVRLVGDSAPTVTLANTPAMPALDVAPPLFAAPPDEVAPPKPDGDSDDSERPDDAQPVPEPVALEATAEVAAAIPNSEVAAADDAAPPPALSQSPVALKDTAAIAEPAPKTESPAVENAEVPTPAPAPSPPLPTAEEPTIAAVTPYSLRSAPGRLGLVVRDGGSAQTEEAVTAALRWLAAAQSRDGRWEANLFGAGQEQAVLGHNRGGAGRGADTGISALALLAFLGAGHTHLEGEYRDTVRRGLDFLLRSQAADGSLFGNATLYAQMYCHSMATFALAEAQAITGDGRLEPPVRKAVAYSVAAQNSTTGGWRYRPGDSGDTSQLGWQMMALASAERAGVEVSSETWARIERFLRSVRRGNYGGLASYRPDSGPSTSMTAEALYCRLLLRDVHVGSLDDRASGEATGQLLASLPNTERVNLYYWYYATLALHDRQRQSDRAAEDWRTWNESLTAALLATQVTDGQDAGSWNTNTVWGGYGGRVYTTAMAAMCLEVYYRYAPQEAPRGKWTAARPQSPDAR